MLHRTILLTAMTMLAASAAMAGPYSRYSNDAGNPLDPPIERADPRITAWADTVIDYRPAPGVGSAFRDPVAGYGSLGDLYDPANPPPTGEIPPFSGATQPFLGDVADLTDEYGFIGYDASGQITLGIARGIRDGVGPDFAVFENGADYGTGLVADLAYVEVSTDGASFARFDSISLNTGYLDASWGSSYASIDETNVFNLAGKHLAGWGTPFDLGQLADHAMVEAGWLDLQNVRFVRLVDIPGIGDGTYGDSLGRGIYDSWVTVGAGGFDFRLSEGVAVLHAVPEPASWTLLVGAGAAGACLLMGGRSKVQGSRTRIRGPRDGASPRSP